MAISFLAKKIKNFIQKLLKKFWFQIFIKLFI